MTVLRKQGACLVLATICTWIAGCGNPDVRVPQSKPVVAVVTLKVEPYTFVTELPGRTSPFRVAEVRPQTDGIVQQRLFVEGADVKAGQQLYQIDPSVYLNVLNSANATLASAKSLASRYRELVAEQAVSQQLFDDSVSAQALAQAALEKARIDVRYTKMLAPISGRIGRSATTEGALVTNGQATALATIQQLDPIYVDVTQSATELLRLRKELAAGELDLPQHTQVSLRLPDGSLYDQAGTLKLSEATVDAGTGSVTFRAEFPNPNHQLMPGMFVHALLNTAIQRKAILVPQQGVTRDLKGAPTALVVDEQDRVEIRNIEATRTSGDRWIVTRGLSAGDRLIVQGLQFVKPGMEVAAQAPQELAKYEGQASSSSVTD